MTDSTGPAYIDIMPPSPETNRRYYSAYCKECGIEFGMADTADAALLVRLRDEHNATVHPKCECWPTPEKYHFVYYGATEPGSAIEYNPECHAHGEASTHKRERDEAIDAMLNSPKRRAQ